MLKPNEFKNKNDSLKPREQLMRSIAASEVSDDALLAILLKTGSNGCHVVELARRLIDAFGSLRNLVNSDWRQIQERIACYNKSNTDKRILGIGLVKCLELAAAFELGRRGNRMTFQDLRKRQIRTPSDAYDIFFNTAPISCETEIVYVLPLDSKNRPICEPIKISDGSVSFALIEPIIVFREAVRWSAKSIIVAHSHPSGDPTPSKEDIEATLKLKEAAKILNVTLLDHLVLGTPNSNANSGYVSIEEYC